MLIRIYERETITTITTTTKIHSFICSRLQTNERTNECFTQSIVENITMHNKRDDHHHKTTTTTNGGNNEK